MGLSEAGGRAFLLLSPGGRKPCGAWEAMVTVLNIQRHKFAEWEEKRRAGEAKRRAEGFNKSVEPAETQSRWLLGEKNKRGK